jgi:hypothetical protein
MHDDYKENVVQLKSSRLENENNSSQLFLIR